MFKIKRVYEPVAPEDGFRVLVDRSWPRGLSRKAAAIDEWLKEIAPPAELLRWFGRHPDRWPEFRRSTDWSCGGPPSERPHASVCGRRNGRTAP